MPVRRTDPLGHHEISDFGVYNERGQNWRQQNSSQSCDPEGEVPGSRKGWLHGGRSKFHFLHSMSRVTQWSSHRISHKNIWRILAHCGPNGLYVEVFGCVAQPNIAY